MAKAISVDIFKPSFGDCSNYGISSKFNDILLLHDDGFIEVDLDNPPENLCKIIRRQLWGEEHDYIEPYAKSKGVGYMFGGTICYSSDARFESSHPLCLHDRDESQEQYDLMFR